jgi:hypothetical protein
MKRDMDLMRKILLAVEESEKADGSEWCHVVEDGVDAKTMAYQILLLGEAGLLIVTGDHVNFETEESDVPTCLPMRLTWAGHEFLDTARDESTWKTATKNILQKTGGLMFDVLKQALIKLATDAIK